MFVENAGQFGEGARFQVRGAERPVWLAEDGIWMTLAGAGSGGVHLRLSFPGANPHPRLEPFDRLATRFSYFTGDDPAGWQRDVPVWGGVRYRELYPGLDLEITSEITGGKGRLVQRLVCGAGCEPDGLRSRLGSVRMRVEGADTLAIVGDALEVRTTAGSASVPLIEVPGVAIAGLSPARVVGDEVVAPFGLGAETTPLQAGGETQAAADRPGDLMYSTFLGGAGDDCPYKNAAIAVDAAGNAYVTGMTESWEFPTTPGAFDTSYPILFEAFAVKVNPDGSGLVYASMLGGGLDDRGRAIAVDDEGCAYVAGITESDNFPATAGAYDESHNSGYYPDDGFVAKFSADGSDLIYATYLGGSLVDRIEGIAVDADGRACVAGTTQSSNFPTTAGAFDTSYNSNAGTGELDAFVARFNAAGSGLDYATFLGGRYDDAADGVALDGAGNAYVIGNTYSPDFPVTPGAYDETHNGTGATYIAPWRPDAFVAKLDPAGSGLAYATFLGGAETDAGYAIALDAADSAYVMGTTNSPDFPTTAGAYDTTFGGGTCGSSPCDDLFVAKLNAAGSGLSYATFLGDAGTEYAGYSMAVDGDGHAYVTGSTRSAAFPPDAGGYDTSFNGGTDAFLVKLNAGGTELAYATFLGGSSTDAGYAVAVRDPDQAYVAGHTDSEGFPTTAGAFDTSHNGDYDVFVSRLATCQSTVSGQVLDHTGSAMAGVHVSTGTAYSATTGTSGNYTLTLPVGTYVLTPTTPGYLWSPASRTVTVPPDATGQDFTAHGIQKEAHPSGPRALAFGETITYTLRLEAPEERAVVLYDRVPTYTAYVGDSLDAPGDVAYDPAAQAISGTVDLPAEVPVAVSFVVRVGITGTAEFGPFIVNQGCIRPADGGAADWECSDAVRNYTYVVPVYLPLVTRSQ